MEKNFTTVEEVAGELKVSKSYAYKVVRELNAEMWELWLSDDIRESEYQLLSQEVMLRRRRLTAVDTVILVQPERR